MKKVAMNRHRITAAIIAAVCLFAYANVASARPAPDAGPHRHAEWRSHWNLAPQAVSLPTLDIDQCADCRLSRQDLSAISQAYALAAYDAGFRLDALSTTQVRIVETGTLENGAPYARGETGDRWFRVGNPRPGESIGAVAGRLTFVILSGAR